MDMSSRSPSVSTPSPLRVASGQVVKKYRRIRSRPSPLSDNVRRRLLAKIGSGTSQSSAMSTTGHGDDCDQTVKLAEGFETSGCQSVHEVALHDRDQSALEEVEVDHVSDCVEQVEPMEVSDGSKCERALNVTINALLAQDQYKCLNVNTLNIDSKTTVIVCRPYHDSSLICPISNPRLCVFEKDGGFHYSFQVFFKEINAGVCTATFSNIECFLQQMITTSGFVVCPGIREYPASVRFNTKNLVVWSEPFNRRFSVNCSQWHIPNNVQQTPGSAGFDCCKPCKQLLHDIRQLQRKSGKVTTPVRAHRLTASSKYPISKLSPASQTVRLTNIRQERKQTNKKLKRLEKYECNISDKQHTEILQLVSSVKDSRAVQELIDEGDRILGEGQNALREAWNQDVVERLEYERDQAKAVTASKGNRWSQVTIRMALAVYSRSPAAYQALRGFKLLQLPCVRTLKYYIDANLESAGDSVERLQESRKQYVALIEEKKKVQEESTDKGSQSRVTMPIGEGSLIIDEVKVGMKLLWSSRNQKFIGHAMSHDELTSLCDVYKTLSPDYRQRQTSYFLQTLWRDFTSDFDVIGPHYSSDDPFAHDALCRIVIDAIQQFHLCGFQTVAIVADGSSSNLKMIKEMSGARSGAYGTDSTAFDPYYVTPYFLSPFTDRNVYFIICPSHQLKNMVAALYQSRLRHKGGTRDFTIDSCSFGWSVIEDMYRRDIDRIKQGHCSRVPKLKESYICRDSWTRLNVQPSKIMQQDEVLAELREHARQQPPPEDASSVELVIDYLSSLNNLFERSLLGRDVRVFDPHGSTIQRIDCGYRFFVQWACKQYPNGDPAKFLSWQTWDLLRIMVYGFKGLVEEFLTTHPGYHINPKRVNGSAIETLFSQLKHTTSGHLTGANYEAAKATLLTQRQAKGKEAYRSTSLYIAQSKLKKK